MNYSLDEIMDIDLKNKIQEILDYWFDNYYQESNDIFINYGFTEKNSDNVDTMNISKLATSVENGDFSLEIYKSQLNSLLNSPKYIATKKFRDSIVNCDLDAIKLAVTEGADTNRVLKYFNIGVALSVARKMQMNNGYMEILKYLISLGAKIDLSETTSWGDVQEIKYNSDESLNNEMEQIINFWICNKSEASKILLESGFIEKTSNKSKKYDSINGIEHLDFIDGVKLATEIKNGNFSFEIFKSLLKNK